MVIPVKVHLQLKKKKGSNMNLTKNINKYIFRGYDIRGVYPTDLNSDVAYTIGKSFGSYVKD